MSAGLQQDLGLGGEHGCLWEVKERECWRPLGETPP